MMLGKQILSEKYAKLELTSNKLSPRRTEDVSFVLFAHQGTYIQISGKKYIQKSGDQSNC